MARIQRGQAEARRNEGNPDAIDGAFGLWSPIYEDCKQFRSQFYHHQSLLWAEKKIRRRLTKEIVVSFTVGVIASLVAAAIFAWATGVVPELKEIIWPPQEATVESNDSQE